jgi:hypothetical protein
MAKVKENERATSTPVGKEKAKLRSQAALMGAMRFDERIERDARYGRLDALADEAVADFIAGRCRDL